MESKSSLRLPRLLWSDGPLGCITRLISSLKCHPVPMHPPQDGLLHPVKPTSLLLHSIFHHTQHSPMASTARRKNIYNCYPGLQGSGLRVTTPLPPPVYHLHSIPPRLPGCPSRLCQSWSLCRDMVLPQIREPHMPTPFLSWPQFLLKYQLLTKAPLMSLPTPAPLSPFVLVLVTTTTCCGCWLPGCPSWNMLLHLADSSPAPRTKLGTQ